MGLETALNRWNGTCKTDLEAIYKEFYRQNDFASQLIPLLRQKQQLAASWLLKDYLQDGNKISDDLKLEFYRAIHLAKDWHTQLHFLQSLPFLRPVPDGKKSKLASFLRAGIIADNKFVRAWAYNGFYDLAQDYPEYQQEANQLIEMGKRDEPASVQARLKQLDMF